MERAGVSFHIKVGKVENCFELKDFSEVEKLIAKSEIADMEFIIKSERYNLGEEATTICYYDLVDEYEDEILEEILAQVK